MLYELIWDQFSGANRLLIDNKYVFQPFWDSHNGQMKEEEWQQHFLNSKSSARRAMGAMDTRKVMGIMFDRNQTNFLRPVATKSE